MPASGLLDGRVFERIASQSSITAVVLERIAYGGGETNWYVCRNRSDADDIGRRLKPGSSVSFYFDDRISCRQYGPAVRDEILDIVKDTGDAVVGQLATDGLTIEMEVIAGPNDLSEYAATLVDDALLYYGAFPGRDDDGWRAITFTVADADGVVRAHPH